VYTGTYKGEKANFTIACHTLNGLQIVGTSYPLSANLQGKCTISVFKQVRHWHWPWFKLLYFSSGTFLATAVDSGKGPGAGSDSFSITVYEKNGVPFKSVPATPVKFGEVIIHLR
jgi:hypothetical protein